MTVEASFKLRDLMTGPAKTMTRSINGLTDATNGFQDTVDESFNANQFQGVENILQTISSTLDGISSKMDEAGSNSKNFDHNIQSASSSADALGSKLKGILATVGSIATVKMGFSWMKENLELADTQRNAENQLAAVLANMGGTQTDYQAILDKASSIQGAGIYGDEAMIAGAAELSTYFSDADAIMSMMDTLSDYAMGMSGGGELDTTAMVDYATNIGKIMSGSYDAMTKKGFEFTDAQKAIIEGTATQQQIVDTLGEEYLDCSEDMQAAAAINSVIAESWDGLYETMSNTPEGQIIQFKNSLGDLRETLGNQIYPAVLDFVNVFNEHFPEVEGILTGITNILSVILGILTWLMEGAFNVYTAFTSWEGFATIVNTIETGILFIMGILQNLAGIAVNVAQTIIQNWSWIGPIIYGVAAIILFYKTCTTLASAATDLWHKAQNLLNSSLFSCPVFWIVTGIIALIAAITAVVRATNTFGSQSVSVLGTICGMVNVVIQFFKNLALSVANIALGIWNALGACCSNIGTAFHNVIANVQGWFYGLLATALTVVEGICAALNKLPFVEFDYSGISAKADEYAAKSAEAYASVEDYTSISDAFNEGFSTFDTFTDGWAQDAFDSGAAFGDGIMDNLTGFIDDIAGSTGMEDLFDFSGLDLDSGMAGYNLGTVADDIADSSANTAGNTAAIADSLDTTEEDLKYLRDIAEREAINRFTTAEITVEQHNENHIDKDVDVDGIMDAWAADFAEKLDVSGEGV